MEKSMGELISRRRKELGMTQRELAEIMGVTDKAVSKWERNLSCPDIASIPLLSKTLELSADELLDTVKKAPAEGSDIRKTLELILKVLPVAMGTAVTVLSVLGEITLSSGFGLLGIGLASAGIYLLSQSKE